MIAATGLRWILTLLFAAPVGYGVWRAILPATRVAERVDHALHAAMGVLMAAMAWPWGMDLSAEPQVVLFSAGALWFLAAAPFRAGDGSRRGALLAVWPHVLMMGAMAWMVAAMNSLGAMAGHSGGGGMHDMHMADASGLAAMTLTGTGPRLVAGVLAAVLAGIGLAWLARALDRARALDPASRPAPTATTPGDSVAGALAPGCHAAMALGMAVMFVLLV
ncbi:DUF5134 domain-containing protein [Streptomyces sp. NPDC001508]|uniref:DUF5134 domain-containing protein n=1 Tax=Streptomyces sp. NPDC001508 TaxID=3154656 RepID=UPI0033183B42